MNQSTGIPQTGKMIQCDSKTQIKVYAIENGICEAVFNWNDGELNSKTDFEIPIFAHADDEANAIRLLIEKYNSERKNNPVR